MKFPPWNIEYFILITSILSSILQVYIIPLNRINLFLPLCQDCLVCILVLQD
jgi:hypothetical protein